MFKILKSTVMKKANLFYGFPNLIDCAESGKNTYIGKHSKHKMFESCVKYRKMSPANF